MSSLAGRQEHHAGFLKNLRRSVNALLAGAAVMVAGCGILGVGGSSTPALANSYLYSDKYHSTMFALHIVQHGARLTGTFESLLPVTSQQAGDNPGETFLDEHGNPLPPFGAFNSTDATGRSDNGACGGTSVCLEYLNWAITGQVGIRGRVSIDLGWGNQLFGDQTLIAQLHGGTLVFSFNGAKATFQPADERSIQQAHAAVFTALRTLLIPVGNLDQETQYLRGPTSLADDVSGLQGILDNVNQSSNGWFINPYVCDFQQSFTDQVNQTQQDINAASDEVQKARTQLKPYLRQGGTLAAYGRASGVVSKLQAAITSAVAKINDTARKANGVIAEAKRDAPKIINAMNGLGCTIAHTFDIWLHGLHIALTLAELAG